MKAELVINKREVITPYSRYKKLPGKNHTEDLKQIGNKIVSFSLGAAVVIASGIYLASVIAKLEACQIVAYYWYAMTKVVWMAL
jgi:hypothetical protein